MKEENVPGCGHENELVGFLYGELSEIEQRSFKAHLHNCTACHDQLTQFILVRESIGAWRQESLGSYLLAGSSQIAQNVRHNRSAISALRAFFDLSPLWMKGAAAFAAILFLVVGSVAFIQWRRQNVTAAPASNQARYSQAEVDRLVEQRVKEEVAMRASSPAVAAGTRAPVVTESSEQRIPTNRSSRANVAVARYSQIQKAQRPLSRTERAELAADLRLVSSTERSLNLIEDQINQ
ncbi:MAG TPA: zf-HC2 domain-containing protein [Pyrinomonadaceae bacterium]|nr:zf-HC2 domain-containing protein [Pyrinomonadaceae bacterium]